MTPSNRDFRMSQSGGGAAVTVHVTSGAAQDALRGILPDGSLDVHLKAKDDGAVNTALIAMLAKRLGVEAEHFEIVAGVTSSNKLIAISHIDAQTVEERLRK